MNSIAPKAGATVVAIPGPIDFGFESGKRKVMKWAKLGAFDMNRPRTGTTVKRNHPREIRP